jgi:hypothetical protein
LEKHEEDDLSIKAKVVEDYFFHEDKSSSSISKKEKVNVDKLEHGDDNEMPTNQGSFIDKEDEDTKCSSFPNSSVLNS